MENENQNQNIASAPNPPKKTNVGFIVGIASAVAVAVSGISIAATVVLNPASGNFSGNNVDDNSMHTHIEEIIPAVPAGCSTNGKTQGQRCSVCQTVLLEPTTIAPTGEHNYEETITKEATCVSVGTKQLKCTDCGKTYTESYTKKIMNPVNFSNMHLILLPKLSHTIKTVMNSPWVADLYIVQTVKLLQIIM